MILLLVFLLASEPKFTVDCDIVRAMVAEHGKAKAFAWAVRNGYSWTQIAVARKCLR